MEARSLKETIRIPDDIEVLHDNKAKVKTIAFFFHFLSGKKGVLSITSISPEEWIPHTEIESITIKYKQQ